MAYSDFFSNTYPINFRVNGTVLPPVGGGGPGSSQSLFGATGSQVFYVNSAVTGASDVRGKGLGPGAPFKTINFAVTQCLANNGDVIYVGPQHVETVAAAAALTVGVAGVSIIGLGNDITDRPKIQYTTSTAATVTITAAGVTIQGMRIENSIDARVDGLIISGADCRLIDCEFTDDTGTSSLISVRTTSAGARLKMYGCKCYYAENSGTGRTEFLRLVGGTDHEIQGFYNDPLATYSTAVVNNVTTATSLLMRNCVIQNGGTAVAAAFLAATQIAAFQCEFGTAGTSAVTMPTQGNATVDLTSTVTSSSTFGYQGPLAQGQPVAFQKSVTSSAIVTGGLVAMTCTGGSLVIENIVAETDSTGLATGTNVNPTINNANGISAVLTAGQLTVANLGANATQVFSALTGWKSGFVWEAGKALTLTATGANCTGSGKLFITVYGRVLSGAPVLT